MNPNHLGVRPATVYVEISTPKDGLADSSIFLLPGQIAETPTETWRLLLVACARASYFLVSHVGTEIALPKIKTNSR
jgi:hypothetical protein